MTAVNCENTVSVIEVVISTEMVGVQCLCVSGWSRHCGITVADRQECVYRDWWWWGWGVPLVVACATESYSGIVCLWFGHCTKLYNYLSIRIIEFRLASTSCYLDYRWIWWSRARSSWPSSWQSWSWSVCPTSGLRSSSRPSCRKGVATPTTCKPSPLGQPDSPTWSLPRLSGYLNIIIYIINIFETISYSYNMYILLNVTTSNTVTGNVHFF